MLCFSSSSADSWRCWMVRDCSHLSMGSVKHTNTHTHMYLCVQIPSGWTLAKCIDRLNRRNWTGNTSVFTLLAPIADTQIWCSVWLLVANGKHTRNVRSGAYITHTHINNIFLLIKFYNIYTISVHCAQQIKFSTAGESKIHIHFHIQNLQSMCWFSICGCRNKRVENKEIKKNSLPHPIRNHTANPPELGIGFDCRFLTNFLKHSSLLNMLRRWNATPFRIPKTVFR